MDVEKRWPTTVQLSNWIKYSFALAVLSIAASALHGVSGEDRAAEEATSYWRGGRVRAEEEPNLPAPRIETVEDDAGAVSIDYHGEPNVKECLEYYIDKQYEESATKERLLRLERDIARQRRTRNAECSTTSKNWDQCRPRAVITFLLMENSGRTLHLDLLLSLRCLGKYFKGYPVAVFYTNASTQQELANLRAGMPGAMELILEEVALEFPPEVQEFPGGVDGFLSPPECVMDGVHRWSTQQSCGCRCPAWRPQCWPLNWMHATRFFTAGMFRTKAFTDGNFDFFLRMDTDLFFVETPAVDPFVLMATAGCGMVYDSVSREAPGCYDGFDDATTDFLTRYGYVGQPDWEIAHVGQGPAAAGGQWTIGDAKLFTSDRYLRFADFAAGGIYKHRWADQLFLLRGLCLFGPRSGNSIRMHPLWSDPGAGSTVNGTLSPSICIRSLFDGGTHAGFVHQKGGYEDHDLLKKCDAEDVTFGPQ